MINSTRLNDKVVVPVITRTLDAFLDGGGSADQPISIGVVMGVVPEGHSPELIIGGVGATFVIARLADHLSKERFGDHDWNDIEDMLANTGIEDQLVECYQIIDTSKLGDEIVIQVMLMDCQGTSLMGNGIRVTISLSQYQNSIPSEESVD